MEVCQIIYTLFVNSQNNFVPLGLFVTYPNSHCIISGSAEKWKQQKGEEEEERKGEVKGEEEEEEWGRRARQRGRQIYLKELAHMTVGLSSWKAVGRPTGQELSQELMLVLSSHVLEFLLPRNLSFCS